MVRLPEQPGDEMVRDGQAESVSGTERVALLIAACGGATAACRTTGISPSTLYTYARIGRISSAQHAVALCRLAQWATGTIDALSGLGPGGVVAHRSTRAREWDDARRPRDAGAGKTA